MTVGINSYVAVGEADDYIFARYSGTRAADVWTGKSNEHKEILLMSACADMETLPFTGHKRIPQQPLAFPRWPDTDVPPTIKNAQIEIMLLDLTPNESDTDAEARLALQRQGVASYSIGDLSESYSGVSDMITRCPFMSNSRISGLLQRWLSGGYAIC